MSRRRSSLGAAAPWGRLSRQDGSLATVCPGVPGHDGGAAFVRLRRGKLVDGPSGQRVHDTAEGPYEVVCPGRGDDPSRDWSQISEKLRRIRGIYSTKEGAEAALVDHVGHADALIAASPPRRGAASLNSNHAESWGGLGRTHAEPPIWRA